MAKIQRSRPGSLGFNGELPEPRSGLYLLGNGYRGYNPVLMRFNAPDSWSPFARGGLNAYAYCLGDPVNGRDPTGHFVVLNLLSAVPDLVGGVAMSRAGSGKEDGKGGSFDIGTLAMVLGGVALGSVLVGGLFDNIQDFARISRKSLFRRHSFSGEPSSPPRRLIENEVAGLYPEPNVSVIQRKPTSFPEALRSVNASLASHGDDTLSMPHAQDYVKLAKSVEQGDISNTTAHLKAAEHWRQVPGPGGQVGNMFNLFAAFFSGGVVDKTDRTTGKNIRIRRTPTPPPRR